MRIAGSLWSVDPCDRPEQLDRAVEAGLRTVHWDASDGSFAAAGGFTPQSAAGLLGGHPGVESEAHLMSERPFGTIPAWSAVCTLIVVPLEIEQSARALDLIAAQGVQPAVAVSLSTRLDAVPADLPVLLMAIPPGESGKAHFDPSVIDRARMLRERGRNELIGVDGDVQLPHVEALARAGVNWVVSGSSLFAAQRKDQWIHACTRALASSLGGASAPWGAHGRRDDSGN